jgi:hypothetical protein
VHGLKNNRGTVHEREALLALAAKNDYNPAAVLDIKESGERIKEDLHFSRSKHSAVSRQLSAKTRGFCKPATLPRVKVRQILYFLLSG